MDRFQQIRQEYRGGCLSTATVIDFVSGRMPEREARLVKKHLRDCRHCQHHVKAGTERGAGAR